MGWGLGDWRYQMLMVIIWLVTWIAFIDEANLLKKQIRARATTENRKIKDFASQYSAHFYIQFRTLVSLATDNESGWMYTTTTRVPARSCRTHQLLAIGPERCVLTAPKEQE